MDFMGILHAEKMSQGKYNTMLILSVRAVIFSPDKMLSDI